jgi:hypothetical protein
LHIPLSSVPGWRRPAGLASAHRGTWGGTIRSWTRVSPSLPDWSGEKASLTHSPSWLGDGRESGGVGRHTGQVV